MKTSWLWNGVVPWSCVVIVLSCGARTVAPVAPAPGPAAAIPEHLSVKSLETDEIVIRGKDGKPRGKLSGDGLTLADEHGNTIALELADIAKIRLTGKGGTYKVQMSAEGELATISTSGGGNVAILGVEKDATAMMLTAGKRKLSAGVEVSRPLADIEAFDADGKRRMSIGLNSNGSPRFALYDAKETRRIYGILDQDSPVIDLNDATGTAAVELFAADPAHGSGIEMFHGGRAAAIYGVGTDGKKR